MPNFKLKQKNADKQKRLLSFQSRIRQYIRKTSEYKELLELGLVDISEADEDVLHLSNEDACFLYFECEILIGDDNTPIEYEVTYRKIHAYGDLEFKAEWLHKLPKDYTMPFYKITKGILIGLKKLKGIYLDRLKYTTASEEIEFINTLTREQTVLHINRKWEYAYSRKLFLDKLKTRNKEIEAEIA